MPTKGTIELDGKEYSNLLNRIKFFQTIVLEISARKPIEELLDQIMESSKKLLDAEAASLLLFNKDTGMLDFHTVKGGAGKSLKTKGLKLGDGIGGWVAEKREPIIMNDCYNDPRFNKDFDIATGFHTSNMVCTPMIANDNLIGVIQVINKKGKKKFSVEDMELFEALSAQCAVAISNAHSVELEIKAGQIKHEMDTAWKIQQRFLPDKLPLIKNAEMYIKLKPAKEIGGDYYNIIKVDDDNFLFFVADVSGKSVSAALIVSTIYSFLQFYVLTKNSQDNPTDLVQAFNRFLISSTTSDKFATAWFGFYNQADKKLVSINAGHNPPYLLKNNESALGTFTAGGLILGSIDMPYESETIQLDTGDKIVFYTDGVTEAMNIKEEEFGEMKFEDLLAANKNLSTKELSDIIFTEIKNYRGEAEQSDDITLGIIHIL